MPIILRQVHVIGLVTVDTIRAGIPVCQIPHIPLVGVTLVE